MEIDQIKQFVIGLCLVTLIAAVGGLAINEFRTTIQQDSTSTVTNESATISSYTGSLGKSDLYISKTACRYTNGSKQQTLEADRTYNISSTGTITVAENMTITTIYCDYSYYTPTHQRNITTSGLSSLDNTTSYFRTAGTIMGVSFILLIVLGAFYFIQRKTTQ